MSDPPPSLQLVLAVSIDKDGRWSARAELPDGSVRLFDSPFELARFVAQSPPQAATGPRGGLR